MSYTTEISFGNQQVNSSGDLLELILTFTHDLAGTDREWNASDHGMRVREWGNYQASYNFENALLVPGGMGFLIGDMDGDLEELFFGTGAIAVATDKQAKVELKLNSVSKFIGYLPEDSIRYSPAQKSVNFKAFCETNIVNQKKVYEDGYYTFVVSGVSTWPAEGDLYTNNGSTFVIVKHTVATSLTAELRPGSTNDPAASGNLTKSTGSGDASIAFSSFADQALNPLDYALLGYKNIITVIEDIYKLVNPAVTLDFYSNFLMEGIRIVPPPGGETETDIPFDECELWTKYLYGYPASGITTCGGILKQLAFDTGSFTGMLSDDKAFFKKLFYYNSSNAQTLGHVKDYEKAYRYGLIDYVKVSLDTDLFQVDLVNDVGPVAEAGVFSGMTGRSLDKKSLMGAIIGYSSMEYTKVTEPASGLYRIESLEDDTIGGGYLASNQLLANFWLNFRGDITNCRVDRFEVEGVDYDFLKDFPYEGSKYQPISMIINYPQDTTEFNAIYLGEL